MNALTTAIPTIIPAPSLSDSAKSIIASKSNIYMNLSLNDFINHSYLCKYIIRINNIEAFENNAVQIKKFEERKLNAVDVLDDFNKLFMSYYNKENYMNELSEVLSNYESNTFD